MSEKPRFNLDVPLGEDVDEEPLLPISFGAPTNVMTPAAKEKRRKPAYSELSPYEKARQDTKIGTIAATAAGAIVGTGFVGAGLSAPITLAAVGGALAWGKLKEKEIGAKKH